MIRYFSEHPTASNLLMVGILALGLNALPHLQRDTFRSPRQLKSKSGFPIPEPHLSKWKRPSA